jgi:uncharacterized protein (DUF58 family)
MGFSLNNALNQFGALVIIAWVVVILFVVMIIADITYAVLIFKLFKRIKNFEKIN